MKIQLDIPEELNKALKIYRIQAGYKNMSEAILALLEIKLIKEVIK